MLDPPWPLPLSLRISCLSSEQVAGFLLLSVANFLHETDWSHWSVCPPSTVANVGGSQRSDIITQQLCDMIWYVCQHCLWREVACKHKYRPPECDAVICPGYPLLEFSSALPQGGCNESAVLPSCWLLLPRYSSYWCRPHHPLSGPPPPLPLGPGPQTLGQS